MVNEQTGGAQTREQAVERRNLLKDILADDNKSAFFGEMLRSEGKLDVAERLKMKKVTGDDVEALTGKDRTVDQFLERMKSVETLSGMISSQNLEKLLAGKSKKLLSLEKAVGVDGIRSSIVSQLEALAMKDPQRIQTLLKSFEAMTGRETRQYDANNRINRLFEQYGISKDAYQQIAQIPSATGRQEALKDLLDANMGKVKGLRFKTIERNRQERERELQLQVDDLQSREFADSQEIQAQKNLYNAQIRNTSELLGATIFGTEEMMDAFNKVLNGEDAEEGKKEMLSFESMKDIKLPDHDEMIKEWTMWSDAETAAGRTVDQKNTDDQKHFFDMYTNKKTGNQKGAWSDVIKNLIKGIAKF